MPKARPQSKPRYADKAFRRAFADWKRGNWPPGMAARNYTGRRADELRPQLVDVRRIGIGLTITALRVRCLDLPARHDAQHAPLERLYIGIGSRFACGQCGRDLGRPDEIAAPVRLLERQLSLAGAGHHRRATVDRPAA